MYLTFIRVLHTSTKAYRHTRRYVGGARVDRQHRWWSRSVSGRLPRFIWTNRVALEEGEKINSPRRRHTGMTSALQPDDRPMRRRRRRPISTEQSISKDIQRRHIADGTTYMYTHTHTHKYARGNSETVRYSPPSTSTSINYTKITPFTRCLGSEL